MEQQTIDLGYRPRDQFIAFHTRKQRWSCIVAHRRAGKTVACIVDLIDAALRSDKNKPRFAYIAPYYAQAKDVAWAYLKEYTAGLPGVSINEGELRVDLHNGARIRLYGADNYDRLRGIYLDGAVLDEFADMDPRAWSEVIRPALSDRKGWAIFIGTPKGRNTFYELFEHSRKDVDWYSLRLRASETGIVDNEELDDARLVMTPEQFEQEYECSFDAAILGAYYGKEMADAQAAGRLTDVEYEPSVPVQTAWDLGISDCTSIWFFQVVADEIRVIDFYENSAKNLGHYAGIVMSKPYKYTHHWLPHDAKVRSLETGRTRVETLKVLGLEDEGQRLRLVPDHKVMDGINAARVSLEKCWFDETRCHHGIECLRQYHADFDEKARVFRTTPKHDWSSHAADAFRYLAMAWREQAAEPARERKPKELIYEADPKTGRLEANMSVYDIVMEKQRKRRRAERR